MQAIELEISIGNDGRMQLPDQYQQIYGRTARFVILLPDTPSSVPRPIDPMKYSNTLDWPVDGMAYQQEMREEWK